MKSIFSTIALLALLLPHSGVAASREATIGIYAVVDQVILDQEGPSPNQVRIYGLFVIPVPEASGFYYRVPQRGYLYFKLPPGGEQAARSDWKKLKTLVGTGQVVGFASYWAPGESDSGTGSRQPLEVRIHKESDDASPETYPASHSRGVIKAGDPDFDEKIAGQLQRASQR